MVLPHKSHTSPFRLSHQAYSHHFPDVDRLHRPLGLGPEPRELIPRPEQRSDARGARALTKDASGSWVSPFLAENQNVELVKRPLDLGFVSFPPCSVFNRRLYYWKSLFIFTFFPDKQHKSVRTVICRSKSTFWRKPQGSCMFWDSNHQE